MILDELLTPQEMRAVEMNAEYLGVSRLQLMENAGRAIARAVKEKFDSKARVTVVCGPGGNGGDGLVAARHLAGEGFTPEVAILGRPKRISSEETRKNLEALERMAQSVRVTWIGDSAEIGRLEGDVIIDALLGTGIVGALSSPFREMVEEINASPGFKIAVDVPSGIEAGTGGAKGSAVNADLTITFHKAKTGLQDAADHTGRLRVQAIGVPPEAETFSGPGDVYIASRDRPSQAHKGEFGRVLVVGGSETYSGAPALAAIGAYATGVDLVYVAAPETVSTVVAGFSPSLITLKLKGKRLSPKNVEKLNPLWDRIDAVVVGPGLGLHEKTGEAVMTIIEEVEGLDIPVLIDADALKIYPRRREIATEAVFTPHHKEFMILTGRSVEGGISEVGRIVKKEAGRLEATILLKGHTDVISDGTRTRYNLTGNPGMTVGGTGDVLSGVTAGFMAKGVSPLQAAVAAAFINGAAGDAVLQEKGYHIQPMDIVGKIPYIIEDALAGRLRAQRRP